MRIAKLLKVFRGNTGLGLLIFFIALIQIPFVHADPDSYLSFGRGIWTDPGLYSAQLKSFLVNGDWQMKNSPCLLITPLYTLLLFLPCLIFGNSLLVVKVTNLFIFSFIFLMAAKKNKKLIPVYIIFLLFFGFQFQIFHFLHVGLVEIIIAASFCFIFSYAITEDKHRYPKFLNKKGVIISALCLGIFLLKIQYAYAFVIYPVYLIFESFINGNFKDAFRNIVYAGIYGVIMIFLYLIFWVGFNYTFFVDTMSGIDSSKYYLITEWITGVNKNYKQVFLTFESTTHFYVFVISLILSIALLYQKTTPVWAKKAILFFYAWIMIELTKFLQIYLPTRYVLSLYVACGLFASLISYIMVAKLIHFVKNERIFNWQIIPIIVLLIFLAKSAYKNVIVLKRSLTNRSYSIQQANHYFKSCGFKEGVVLGSWGATMTSGSNFTSLPVWHQYFNCGDENQQALKPVAIISEFDQAESNQCFQYHGNNMLTNNDSIKTMTIGKWDVNIHWLKKTE